jgi:protein phosphatase
MFLSMVLDAYGNTDIGLVRERNEDSFWVDNDHRSYAIADGIGGLPDGKLASSFALDCFKELLLADHKNAVPNLHVIFDQVNERVSDLGFRQHPDSGIGTTLTGVHLNQDFMWVGHVGDCALFRYRNGDIEQITAEHTIAEELKGHFSENDDIELPEYFYHTLTQCIGQQNDLDTEVLQLGVRLGDRYIICSDGVSKCVPMDDIGIICGKSKTARECVDQLIEETHLYGAADNSTIVSIFIS